jgi:hypothetical protein
VKEEVSEVSWMTLTGSIAGVLGLAGIIGTYAFGMAADRRTREQTGRRRDYLRADEELGGYRRAA